MPRVIADFTRATVGSSPIVMTPFRVIRIAWTQRLHVPLVVLVRCQRYTLTF